VLAENSGRENGPTAWLSRSRYKIIDYRKQHGAFSSVDYLDGIAGIGPARLEQVRDLVAPYRI
jgi:hypothetical protein